MAVTDKHKWKNLSVIQLRNRRVYRMARIQILQEEIDELGKLIKERGGYA